jgi:hypothetical protein
MEQSIFLGSKSYSVGQEIIRRILWNLKVALHCRIKIKTKTPWLQSSKQTIPTERAPLVGEVSAHFNG